MVLGLGRRKQRREAAEQQDAADAAADSFHDSYGRIFTALPLDPQLNVPDSVDEELAGQYPEEAVDNVKQFERPAWREEDSSLDPISDLEDYYEHDFKVPPEDYDRIQQAAKQEVRDLEQRRAPLPADAAERINARRRMVEGRSLEAVKLLKLKAYERGMAQLRAARDPATGTPADPEARKEYLQSKGAPLDVIPAELIDMTPAQYVSEAAQRLRQQKQQQARRAAEAAAAAAAAEERYRRSPYAVDEAGSEPTSEWEEGWDAKSWADSPQVRNSLAAALGSVMGSRSGGSGGRDGSRGPQVAALTAAAGGGSGDYDAQSGRQYVFEDGEGTDGAGDGGVNGGVFQAYTPAYEALLRKRAALQRHRQQRGQAFWASLVVVVGAGAARWLFRRVLRRRRGGAGNASSGNLAGKAAAAPAAAAAGSRTRRPEAPVPS